MSTMTLDVNERLDIKPDPTPEPEPAQGPETPPITEMVFLPPYITPHRKWGKRYTAFGLTKTLQEWANLADASYSLLYARINHPRKPKVPATSLLEVILRSIILRVEDGRMLGERHYVINEVSKTSTEWEIHLGLPIGSLNGLRWAMQGGSLYDPATRTHVES